MSSPLAIAGVTAVLKDLLNDGLLNQDLSSIGSFSVTALPPDRITTGQTEPNQLNLFLYQVSANPAWRNMQLPSRDGNGNRLTNQPLALDLHYLLTAYGSEDFNAEILLGYALHLLHETPVLSRDQLRTVLGGVSPVDGSILPSPFGTLSAADLADQLELIKITPVYLSVEDLSKMWAAMQARYRPTMAYVVSVVLIEGTAASKAAPPVLTRGADDTGPKAIAGPLPSLSNARPFASELLPAVRLGEQVLLSGSGLGNGTNMAAVFTNQRYGIEEQSAVSSGPKPGTLVAAINGGADPLARWAVGMYAVSLRITRPNLPVFSSNGVPIALAPTIQISPSQAAPGDDVTVRCSPRIRPEQQPHTSVIFGSTTIVPDTINTPADPQQPTTLTFNVPAVDPGDYLVRLRVDGIDSIPVTVTGTPAKLEFDSAQKVTVT